MGITVVWRTLVRLTTTLSPENLSKPVKNKVAAINSNYPLFGG